MSRPARLLMAAFFALWVPPLLAVAYYGLQEGHIRIPSRIARGVIYEYQHPLVFYGVVAAYIVIAIGLAMVAWQSWRARP